MPTTSIHAQTHLETLFILDGRRIVSTREPNLGLGPECVPIRRADSRAWALGSAMGDEQAREVTIYAGSVTRATALLSRHHPCG